MSFIGYARVSTSEQNPDSQTTKLEAAGATRIFVDHGESSRRAHRPQLDACLDYLRVGDTLIVTSLDRLAGTTTLAIELINALGERGINIKSLTEPDIDTTTPMGRALFGIVAVFAQLRVDMIRANTLRGLAHARSQGRIGGRPRALTDDNIETARALHKAGHSYRQIARLLNVSASTISRRINPTNEQPDGR